MQGEAVSRVRAISGYHGEDSFQGFLGGHSPYSMSARSVAPQVEAAMNSSTLMTASRRTRGFGGLL